MIKRIESNDPSPLEKEQRRSFTGNKLDWLTALSADPRLNARAFEVGFQIAQHVNLQSGLAILSDDTISDKTSIPRRWVARARNDLRECGWIEWQRTKTANIYWTRGEQLNAVMDHQILLKDGREARKKKLKTARQVLPPVAHLKAHVLPPVADRDLPPVADRDLPQVANIHLSSYTLVDTPSKNLPSIEQPLPAISHPQLAETRLIQELGEGDPDRGLSVAETIGDARFRFLLAEIQAGRLYPSAVRSASARHAQATREVAA
jgi:hypothetical protein